MRGNEIDAEYIVNGERGENQNNYISLKENIETKDQAQEIFGYWLETGETVHCTIKVTMITGSNLTVHNAFVVDVTEEQKNINLLSLVEK